MVVMQRLHIDDLAGHLLQQKDWEVMSLPAIAETVDDILVGPGLFHHREVGDLLHPERQPQKVLDELKAGMGSYLHRRVPAGPGARQRQHVQWEWFNFSTRRR